MMTWLKYGPLSAIPAAVFLGLSALSSCSLVQGLPPGDEPDSPMCSSTLEVSAGIGPAGGVVSLPPVRLLVPKGALESPTTIRLVRHPSDHAHSATCSYRDTYTVEPFLLASAVNRDANTVVPSPPISAVKKPFLFFWLVDTTELSRAESTGAVCPKVSWTDDPARSSCYAIASMRDHYSVKGYFNYDGRREYGIQHFDTWQDRDRREGCILVRPRRADRTRFFEFEFLAERLGHFRLLRQTDAERDRRVDNFRKPGSVCSTPEGLCRFVPETSRRSIHFLSGMGDDDMFWQLTCKASDQCEDGMWCLMPNCKGSGFCVLWPTDCSKEPSIPVCGCDGITYRNDCEAEKLGVSWHLYGPCRPEAPRDANDDVKH